MKWDTCVKDYLELVEKGCPEEIRPSSCKYCAGALFHKHGSYIRSVITTAELLKIVVFRFKCTSCDRTCSVLPSFLRRNHAATLDVQEHVVRRHQQGLSLRTISEQLPLQLTFSEKTLWRWKSYWLKLLNRLKPILWPAVLARFPHLSLPRGSGTPSSTWDWFFWVWDATQKLWKDRPPGAFEWLALFSRQVAVTAEG